MERTPEIIEFLIAIGAGSAITAFVTSMLSKKKTSAEIEKIETESDCAKTKLEIEINATALKLVESLRKEVTDLRVTVEELKKVNNTLFEENKKLRCEIDTLRDQMREYEQNLKS